MWLLDVRAVLDRDDIRKAQRKTKVLQQFDAEIAKYAILSHRWGTEIDYDDMNRFMTMDEKDGVEISECDGYQKIIRSCEQAQEDGYCWMWIDTCCIDKRSNAELSEAINSMYRWYHNAQRCYVYLSDVEQSVFPTEQDFGRFVTSNGWPEWFSRGWTLQELIAPKEVTFFNKGWVSLGTKRDLTSTLEIITRIPQEVFRDEEVLRGSDPSKRPSVAQIMSWAADRETTRVEDRAYSLLGLFGVNMPMLYGEGSKAFERLQLEIIRVSSDHSIFAWNTKGQFQEYGTILADDPSCFRGCHDIVKVTPEEFSKRLRKQLNENQLDADTQCGKCISLCNSTGMDSPRLLRFDVTNLGIHVSLPVLSLGDNDSPRLRTILPCCDRFGNLITIDLDSRGLSSCYRSLHAGHDEYHACPEFRSRYLACFRNSKQSGYRLRLDDRGTCQFGFTRCGTFPRKIANDEVVLSSQGNTFIVVVYASNAFISRFAVGLGYHLGRLWARVFCDDCAASQEARVPWAGFAKQAYDIMWNAPIHTFCRIPDTTEDVHLPRSIYDVRIVCGSGAGSDTDLKIDIERCPGCCGGPRKYVLAAEPWPLWKPRRSGSRVLELDGRPVRFTECCDQEFALGDYGTLTSGNIKRCGNIFRDMEELGIDLRAPDYLPVVSPVCDFQGYVLTSCSTFYRRRRLRRHKVEEHTRHKVEEHTRHHVGVCTSLPLNPSFRQLLSTLYTCLADKFLVSHVIQPHQVQNVGRWTSVEGAMDRQQFFARPPAWRRLACTWRRKNLERIRGCFHMVANLHAIVGSEARDKCVEDLSATFGLEYLKNYVGEIRFFERLPLIMQTQLCAEPAIGPVGVISLSAYLSNPSLGPRYALPNLLPKAAALCYPSTKKRKMQCEVESISQTLGFGLFQYACNTLLDAAEDNQGQVCHTDFDTVHVRSSVQKVQTLQAKLQATEDEDAQQALEEDITGEILWFCWRGIRSEIDLILAAAVTYVRNDADECYRAGLLEITEIIKRTSYISTNVETTYLRRVMHDAGIGVSKYGLWLEARAADAVTTMDRPG